MKQGMRILRNAVLLLTVAAFALSACSTNQVDKSRGEAFKQYETIIRWSQWDAAADFIALDYQKDNPITRLEMDRLRLFRVTAYNIRSNAVYDEGRTARQVVEIKMFNSHQGVERTILDEQEWRYDEERERWLLYSGLPDPTKRY